MDQETMKYIDAVVSLTDKSNKAVLSEIKSDISEIKKDIREILIEDKKRNGRIGKCEDEILAKNVFCAGIQDEKDRQVKRSQWQIKTLFAIIGLILTGTALWANLFYRSQKDKHQSEVPVKLIFKDTDSTYIFPDLFFRKPGNQVFTPISKVYVDIENNKK